MFFMSRPFARSTRLRVSKRSDRSAIWSSSDSIPAVEIALSRHAEIESLEDQIADLGRSSTVHTVEIRDEADRLISIARVANRILVRSNHD